MDILVKNIASFNELELKGYLIGFIERAKDRAQLLRFVQAVEDVTEDSEAEVAAFWHRYSPEQRAELEKSYEESYNPSKWVSHEDVMKKYEQWLK
jgi:hypothetical protein